MVTKFVNVCLITLTNYAKFAENIIKMPDTNIINLENIDTYNRMFGLETINPLVAVPDLSRITKAFPTRFKCLYGFYAVFLKDTRCGNILYGRQPYDYQEGTIVCFAPGQVTEVESDEGVLPKARGLLFHPDLIRGTNLGQNIHNYSFFSYDTHEALHLSTQERQTISDCLDKIEAEIERPADRHSKKLITTNIEVLLDYCMRFYDRQFDTREKVDTDILSRFERLLDEYFENGTSRQEGLPTVRWFAEKVFLSPNYFGDMIKKHTGLTASEHIQRKIIEKAKEALLSSGQTMSEIAYSLGFEYPQHLSRMFKRIVGCTPNEFRNRR